MNIEFIVGLLIIHVFGVVFSILTYYGPDVGEDEEHLAFKIVLWPVYLLMCIVIGFIKTIGELYNE